MAPPAGGRSPWFYIGIGCGGLLLVFLVAVAAVVWIGFRAVQTVKAELEDPVKRTATATGLLGVDELPEGYQATLNLPVPFFLDLVVLSDREDPRGTSDDGFERMFVYIRMRRAGGDDADPVDLLSHRGFRMEEADEIASGELTANDQQVGYVVHRGRFRADDHRDIESALMSVLRIECPEDGRARFAVWIATDPDPRRATDAVDLAGTPADPDAIRDFLSGLDLCAS